MRLLIDMNLTPRWVPYLISAGHESAHWSDLGVCDAPDDAICEFARVRGFVLITNDLASDARLHKGGEASTTRSQTPQAANLRISTSAPLLTANSAFFQKLRGHLARR
jgi:predicted nuclease of predicted toxin-antitoxin system